MNCIKRQGISYLKKMNCQLPKVCSILLHSSNWQIRSKSDFVSIVIDEGFEDTYDFLQLPTEKHKAYVNNKTSDISLNGLKGFLQKLAVKPKEARMWLRYFQSSPIHSGLPFVIILVNEDVFFQKKMIESLAWSLAFLIQNNMSPIVIFEVSSHPRRFANLLNGAENCAEKMAILGKHLNDLLGEFGTEGRLLIEDQNPLKIWKPRSSVNDYLSTLTVNTSSIFQSIKSHKIPILCNMVNLDDPKPTNPLDILELLISKFQPMKTMILGTDRGIVDEHNKVISDLAIPSDLRFIEMADWLPPSQKYLLKRCSDMVQKLSSSSSVIITAADTIIQELFTHHGTGTMIKCLEKISKYRSSHLLDKKRFNRLLEISFQKRIDSNYWELNDPTIDSIFVSERFSAVGVVMKLPNIDIPYLDKIAVHPESQGSGLAASLWNEICKDYPKLFWRASTVNTLASAWYNTVSQGSWKTDKWTIYWYGLATCEEVLPLIRTALQRPESFHVGISSQQQLDKALGVIFQ